MTNRPALQDHQKAAIDWIHTVNRGLLGDQPGLGKTRTAIEAFDGGKVLVVAPSMVINGGTWSDELEKWANHPEKFTVVPFSMLNAREKTGANASSTRPVNKLRPEVKGRWDAMIVDEAHYTKGRKTTWTWATHQLAKNSGSLLEMTGTPVSNWAHELFTVIRAIFPEKASPGKEFGAYWKWVHRWFNVEPSFFNPKAMIIGGLSACTEVCATFDANNPCSHYLDFMTENLGNQFLRRRRDECLDLPPVSSQTVQIPMDRDQARVYREMKKDYLAEVDGEEVVAWTVGAKNVMLDKITVSPWLLNPQGPPKGGKFEMLRFDLENRARPTVVFAHHRDVVEACAQVAQSVGARTAFVHGGVSKAKAGQHVKDFKAGKLDVIVGSIETMAEGLQLTIADMLIMVETSFKPSRNEQARMRVDRMGQENPVTIRDYLTPGTVDERKREVLAVKTDHQMRLMSARDFAQML